MKKIFEKIKNKLKQNFKNKVIYIDKIILNSFSQAGEDLIIDFLLKDKNIENISYLDIGTYSPDLLSNTYLFYLKGFRGVCVEADKSLVDKIKLKRPGDIVLNKGVNISENDQQKSLFYIFDEPSLNTFDEEEAVYRESFGNHKIIKKEFVEHISLEQILLNYFYEIPTILSIDIEGLDLAVLKSVNLEKYPIPIICVETCKYSENHIRPKDHSIIDYMLGENYFIYGDTYINTIFVNSEWFYSI